MNLLSALNHPLIYAGAMKMIGTRENIEDFIQQYVKPQPGARILDIGCGPARLLEYLPETIAYTGLDINEEYIRDGRRRFGARGRFLVADIATDNPDLGGPFDIVMARGVLHHLPDGAATRLLRFGFEHLKPGGRLITLDNVSGKKISLINRIALSLDRGEYIRDPGGYRVLFSAFPQARFRTVRSRLRIPYCYIIAELTREG